MHKKVLYSILHIYAETGDICMKSVENINEPQKKQKKNKSGAKKALKTIGVIGLVGAIAYGGYKAAGGEFNFLSGSKESKLASSLVAEPSRRSRLFQLVRHAGHGHRRQRRCADRSYRLTACPRIQHMP